METTIFQTLKGSYIRSQWSEIAEIRTHPSFNACSYYLQVSKKSDRKQPRKGGNTIFPIMSIGLFKTFKGR